MADRNYEEECRALRQYITLLEGLNDRLEMRTDNSFAIANVSC